VVASTVKIYENGANGDNSWWVNGKLHRDGGRPAIERANGEKEWWLNGVRYYPDRYPDRWTQQMTPAMVGQTCTICTISLDAIQSHSDVYGGLA